LPIIKLETKINSTLEICFDLSRNIDLHKISTAETNEEAIEEITTGLINLGEFVTWRATHFGVTQKLTSKITVFKPPFHFRDEQLKGIFKLLVHDHFFELKDGVVIKRDKFEFQSSLGIIGRIFNGLILKKYLTRLLAERNKIIKEYAETGKWKQLLEI
jgi:ligand-binding SRPBCC domain-containing protein